MYGQIVVHKVEKTVHQLEFPRIDPKKILETKRKEKFQNKTSNIE